jgi:YfiH family protein
MGARIAVDRDFWFRLSASAWIVWHVESTSIGRIAVPEHIPAGFAVFTTSGDYPGRIIDGGRDLTAVVRGRFGLDTTLTTCSQVHGVRVERARAGGRWREGDACDALWSGEKGVSIAVKMADCLPVTLLDPSHAVIANVHSGWRGAVEGITALTLDEIESRAAFDAPSAFAYLGPSIRVCCFEVGEEVAARFEPRYVDRRRPKAHLDLPAMAADLLRRRGIRPERISDSGLCTRCEGSIFHSFRREKGGGRNLAIAAQ